MTAGFFFWPSDGYSAQTGSEIPDLAADQQTRQGAVWVGDVRGYWGTEPENPDLV